MIRPAAIGLTLATLLGGSLLPRAETRSPVPAPARPDAPRAWSMVRLETRTGCRYVAYAGETHFRRVACHKASRRAAPPRQTVQP